MALHPKMTTAHKALFRRWILACNEMSYVQVEERVVEGGYSFEFRAHALETEARSGRWVEMFMRMF